ncbi:unnamed protein product [Moneuplotes crassus]|uniref:Uncharacterized protein n=2 Tax=Euplotes crassus TaxID=5936 RepID=A0AAD1UGD9_EUPCR|nr:unnamed protein product [Moneuplotes crassus]
MADKGAIPLTNSSWAQKNCSHIFQKYIKDKKTDKFNPNSEIDAIFNDISIQFDLDEYENLLKTAKKASSSNKTLSKAEFEKLLVKWIMMFKSQVVSDLLADSIETVQLKLGTNKNEIKATIKDFNKGASEEISIADLPRFIPELMSTIGVRIVSLSAKQPTSDSCICTDADEKVFYNELKNLASIINLKSITFKTLDDLLLSYFNGPDPKYAFVKVSTYNDDSGLDPFQDLGEENPFAKNKKKNDTADDKNIKETEEDIKKAQSQKDSKKVELLTKIKQYYKMKKAMTAEKERDRMDLMIDGAKKEIAKLDGKKNEPKTISNKTDLKKIDRHKTDNTALKPPIGMNSGFIQTPQKSPKIKNDYDEALIGGEHLMFEKPKQDGYNDSDMNYQDQELIQPYPSSQMELPYQKEYLYPPKGQAYDNNMGAYHKEMSPLNRGNSPYMQSSGPNSSTKVKQNNSYNQSERVQKQKEVERRLEEQTESIEDRRKKAVKEIFDFYTRQHLMIGKKATFEEIQYEMSNMNMGEFLKFCKDFQFPVSKPRCSEIFKKTAKNSKEMFLEHFKESFPRLISMRNKEELEKLEKRLNDVMMLIEKRANKLEANLNPKPKPKSKKNLKNSAMKQINDATSQVSVPLNIQTESNRSMEEIKLKDSKDFNSKIKKSIDKPLCLHKSKGGDPHGIMSEIENKSKSKLKAKKNVGEHDIPNLSSSKRDLGAEKKIKLSQESPLKNSAPKLDPDFINEKISQDREIIALVGEKERIEKQIDAMTKIPEDIEKMTEEALQYLQIDDPSKYKKKIKGFAAPFNMTEKDDRIKKNEKSQKYKFKPQEEKEIIKEKVKQIKQERENAKIKEKQDQEKRYNKNRSAMKNIHEKLMKKKLSNGEIDLEPTQGRNHNPIYNVAKSNSVMKGLSSEQIQSVKKNLAKVAKKLPKKITMGGLTSLNIEDFSGNEPDGFKPTDVINTDSDSDDSILQQYRRNSEKAVQEAYQFSQPNAPHPPQKSRNKNNSQVSKPVHSSLSNPVNPKILNNPRTRRGPAALHSLEAKPQAKPGKRGHTTDHEKGKKNLSTERLRKKLGAGKKKVTKTARKMGNPYSSDVVKGKVRYPAHVNKTARKESKKGSLVLKERGGKPAKNIPPLIGRRHPVNMSADSYTPSLSKAAKLQSKTKRNQEERLKNILKLQDHNMKRGLGVAYKNRIQL